MDQLAPAGVEKEAALRQAGFNDQEVDQWKSETSSQLMGAGFSTPEVDQYFGAKNPDMKPMKQVFKANEEKAAAKEAESTGPKQAKTFGEAIDAGWDMSVSGLIKDKPHTVLPEDAPMMYRIASQVSQLAGDVPAMLAGAGIASVATAPVAAMTGPAAPLVEAAGSAYGTFAMPAAIRKVLMDHYEKGDVHDFSDFWERSAAAFIEGNKQGFVGAATAGVGGVMGKVLTPVVGAAVKTTAQLMSEVATMTTLGKAVEGEMPQPQDFIDGAILVGALHGTSSAVGHIAGKLRSTYAQAGVKPGDVVERAMTDPLIKQDLVTMSPNIPDRIAKENGVPIGGELSQTVEGPGNKEVTGATSKEPVRSEAETKILSQVGEKKTPEGDKYTARSMYKDFVDKLDPISEAVKKLTDEKLPTDQNPYELARMANDYKSKAKYSIEKGTLDFKTLEQTGKGLKDILEPFKQDPQGFEAYLISKRAIEVEGKGLKSGMDLEAAKTVVTEGKSKYEQASKDLYKFKDSTLKYLKDSGVVGEKEFEAMTEMNKSHVSFSRILDESKASGAGGKSLGFLKEFKGSDSKIQSPILSTLENTESIYKAAERNRASSAMIDLALKNKDQTLISRVDKPKAKLGPEQFEVFRDGERQVYEAPKELAESIKSLGGDPAATNIFIKMARVITGIKRLSISLTPDFVVKNFFRDQLTAGSFSKGGQMPFFDAAVAMKDIVGKSDDYYNWLKSGGAGGSFLELNKNYLENNIFELNKETGIIDKAWNTVKKPVQFLEMAGQLAENATRLAEFKKVSEGHASGPKVFAGGMAAREVTVDFTRIGAKTSAYNAITAFMNVSIQGLDRTVRAIKEDPKGVTAKAIAGITVPSVLLWYANKDDERYKELPRWQKDTFWIIPTDSWQTAGAGEADGLPAHLVRNNNGKTEINKGVIYRIPKPQELGILFGSLPERLLEKFFTDNPTAMKDFEGTIQNLLTPSFVPDAIAPFIEQKYNKSLFTDSKIVPGYLESVAPEYQYTEYTSESAKQLAKMIKFIPHSPGELSISSPQVIDNYVRSWSGNLGMYVLRTADEALYKTGVAAEPVKPAWTVADVPVVKAFVIRYPSASAQSIQDLYTNYAKQKETFSTIKHLAGTQNFDALQTELDKIGNGDNVFLKLDGIKDALTKQSQVIHIINRNDQYTSDEKRQLIDGIYYGMIETAKTGNDMLYQMEKLAKEMQAKGN